MDKNARRKKIFRETCFFHFIIKGNFGKRDFQATGNLAKAQSAYMGNRPSVMPSASTIYLNIHFCFYGLYFCDVFFCFAFVDSCICDFGSERGSRM